MTVLHVLFWLLCGCAGVAAGGLVICAAIGLIALAEGVRDRLRSQARLDYERYSAEQSIRSIRREAIRDMLDAERDQRYAYDPDIIEGSAVVVEVKR
jgi:hypothetical protein